MHSLGSLLERGANLAVLQREDGRTRGARVGSALVPVQVWHRRTTAALPRAGLPTGGRLPGPSASSGLLGGDLRHAARWGLRAAPGLC